MAHLAAAAVAQPRLYKREPGGIVPGGIDPNITIVDAAHPIDPKLGAILKQLNGAILDAYRKAKRPTRIVSAKFQPVAYTTQVVAGTNYFVKLLVQRVKGCRDPQKHEAENNRKEYIHVKIFSQPWTNTVELTGISVNKNEGDSLMDPIGMRR